MPTFVSKELMAANSLQDCKHEEGPPVQGLAQHCPLPAPMDRIRQGHLNPLGYAATEIVTVLDLRSARDHSNLFESVIG